MTIREYFDLMAETWGDDVAYEMAESVYEMTQSEDGRWEMWQMEHPEIDFSAMDGDTPVLTLWCWDMCGE